MNVPILRDNVPTNDLTFLVFFTSEEDLASSLVTIQNVDSSKSIRKYAYGILN